MVSKTNHITARTSTPPIMRIENTIKLTITVPVVCFFVPLAFASAPVGVAVCGRGQAQQALFLAHRIRFAQSGHFDNAREVVPIDWGGTCANEWERHDLFFEAGFTYGAARQIATWERER